MTFEETMKKVKDSLKDIMTKDGINDKELEKFTELNSQVDELDKSHKELVESHSKMKDKYIDAITNYGTKQTPEEVGGSPRSMEDIAKDILAKDHANK